MIDTRPVPDPVDVAGRVVAAPEVVGAIGLLAVGPSAVVLGSAVGPGSAVVLRSTVALRSTVVLRSGTVLSVVVGSVGGRIDCRLADVDGPKDSVVGSEGGSVIREIDGSDGGTALDETDGGSPVCETMMLAPAVRVGAVPDGAVLLDPVPGGSLLIADDTAGAAGAGPAGGVSELQAASNATKPTVSASARTELRR